MSELKLQQCRVDGRYDVLDCLGRGSYSEVYVARDLAASSGSPQMVVLKVLNTYLQGSPDADLEETLIENFRNEAVALDRVRHPNIISRLGHGTAIDLQGRVFHYLVLEYLPGGDMQQLCRRRPLKLEGALFYLRQVCAGLEHAHERGVIHRDIKPQNLLLTADQHTLKIADFGVAKLEAADGAITRVGTDVYAAPEHHPLRQTGPLDTAALTLPGKQLTPAADIYSLGKTAYMLLTGESPRRFSQKPVTDFPPEYIRESWAAPVMRVIERATQTNPSKRFQRVQEFWEELQRAATTKADSNGQAHAAGDHKSTIIDLTDDSIQVAPAPPVPSFTEQPLPSDARAKTAAHVRIVVPVSDETHREKNPPVIKSHNEPERRFESRHESEIDEWPRRRVRLSDGAKKWLVALLLIVAFAGMLLATHKYMSREQRPTAAPAPPNSPVGREMVATRDVNIRSSSSGRAERIGMVPNGSIVRVLDSQGGWYKIQIVQLARPKENADDAEQGWADHDFFKARQ